MIISGVGAGAPLSRLFFSISTRAGMPRTLNVSGMARRFRFSKMPRVYIFHALANGAGPGSQLAELVVTPDPLDLGGISVKKKELVST